MKVIPQGHNVTLVRLDNGTDVLVSYQTPVAAHIPGVGYMRTLTQFSVTTSKHINTYLRDNEATEVRYVEQSELAELLK